MPTERKTGRLRRWLRRTALLALSALLVVLAIGLRRGFRYPPLQWEPKPATSLAYSEGGFRVQVHGAIVRADGEKVILRATLPRPELEIQATRDCSGEIWVENLFAEAELVYDEAGNREGWSTTREGRSIRLGFALARGHVARIVTRLPEKPSYRFAAIGDAGGRAELRWCIEKAVALGADFLLHLGDIAYLDGDYESAVEVFRRSPIPIYTAIGNHDFHGGHRNRWRYFQQHFGSRNGWFHLGGADFLNLDTAADLVPADRGERGLVLRAFEAELAERRANDDPDDDDFPLIVFTHRPFADPRVLSGQREEPHALNRVREADWLRDRLLSLGADVLLAGHIHAAFHFDDQGLDTWISGDGLGARGPKKAKLLLAELKPGDAPSFHWEELAMPADHHSRTRDGHRLLEADEPPPQFGGADKKP